MFDNLKSPAADATVANTKDAAAPGKGTLTGAQPAAAQQAPRERVNAGILSKAPDPLRPGVCTVIIDQGSKDGIGPGMFLWLSWLGGAIGSDGFEAASYEVKDTTTIARVAATVDDLAQCDSATFMP